MNGNCSMVAERTRIGDSPRERIGSKYLTVLEIVTILAMVTILNIISILWMVTVLRTVRF